MKTFKVVVKNSKEFKPITGLSKYAAKKLRNAMAKKHHEYNVTVELE